MADFSKLTDLDKHKVFNAIDQQPNQLRQNYADGMCDDITELMGVGIHNVVMAGMGGSALAGNVLKNWLYSRLSVPFEVVRGYSLPEYVNEHTLVILSSQSGNTEETLSTLEYAEKMNTRIVIIASGGKLVDIAKQKNLLLMELEKAEQPRFNVFAGIKALACLLGDMGLAADVDLRRELQDVASWLDIQKSTINLDNDGDDNLSRSLAKQLVGKNVLYYTGPTLSSAAYKWKINTNENAKQMAFYNTYPEVNHNELQGWIFPKDKSMVTVQLESSFDSERIQKRMKVMREMHQKNGFDPIRVTAVGETPLQQLFYSIMLSDYTTCFLGILNDIDPGTSDIVEAFKKELG